LALLSSTDLSLRDGSDFESQRELRHKRRSGRSGELTRVDLGIRMELGSIDEKIVDHRYLTAVETAT